MNVMSCFVQCITEAPFFQSMTHISDRGRFKYINKGFHSLPNDKILDWSNLKAFADDKINMTENLKFVRGREENIEGKGENAGCQHFLFFPQCFQKASHIGSLKVGIIW